MNQPQLATLYCSLASNLMIEIMAQHSFPAATLGREVSYIRESRITG